MGENYQLTEGALAAIMDEVKIPDPVMQVLGSKKIISGGDARKERYRIILSDGKFQISYAMFTTLPDDIVGIGGVALHTVIKLKKYATSAINGARGETRVLLIINMEVIAAGDKVGRVIGNPRLLTEADQREARNSGWKNGSSASNTHASTEASTEASTMVTISNTTTNGNSMMNQSTIGTGQVISPISSLSPYHNRWVIKVRVTNKSNIRSWSNSRGEGKLFSLDLMDESGEIRCTAFRDMVDKYYDMIQVDKVYYMSKCQLKQANKQFTNLKNDYEMTMTNDTIVEECTDDEHIPQVKYDFISVDKIAHMEVGTIVDVIGVCKSSSDIQTLIARTTGRELKKREVALVDQSKTVIDLTLWGAQAESFNGADNPVVLVKSAKVGEFGGGKNISTLMSSQLKINPDIPECYRLKGWYDLEGNQVELKNISARTGGSGMPTPWMTFKEVKDQGLGQSDRGDYYQVMGTILLFRSENAVYKACPTDECNKKVVDLENGMYRCEKCGREYPNFKYRLLSSINVGDWTGSQWISMFSSEAEKVLGKTSQEVGVALEGDVDEAMKIFDNANFRQYIFKCRAKMETYNDEQRLKTVAVNVSPINHEEYNAHLLAEIQKYIA